MDGWIRLCVITYCQGRETGSHAAGCGGLADNVRPVNCNPRARVPGGRIGVGRFAAPAISS